MFWGGGVSYSGTGNYRVDGKIIAACYQRILEENLYSSAQNLCMGCTWTFQHNDFKHKAKMTHHWLQQKKVKIHVTQLRNLQDLETFCQEQ